MPAMGLMDVLGDTLVVRQSNSICPGGNGTTYTSPETQNFTVFCGMDSNGNKGDTRSAQTFEDCMNLCSNAHLPRCGGVSYTSASKSCQLHQSLEEKDLQAPGPGQSVDSALARFPGATTDCRALGPQAVAGGTTFTTRCNRLLDGGDVRQRYAPTFSRCLALCAGAPGCRAASFEASQLSGFANCYLKSAAGGAPGVHTLVDFAIDTGVVAGAGGDDDGGADGAAGAGPSGGGGGGGQAQSTVTVILAPPSGTPIVPPPAAATADPITAPAPTVTVSPSVGGTVSIQVWVATLIFGSVAVLAATAALLVLFKRRRRRPRPQTIGSKKDGADWHDARGPPSPASPQQRQQRPETIMGNITVVSTFGRSFESRDEHDPDGRREWWKRGASPRVSVADSTA